MPRRRRRAARPPDQPWSAEDDQRLRDATACGLSSEFWHVALPGRSFGSIVERRLALGLRPPPLI